MREWILPVVLAVGVVAGCTEAESGEAAPAPESSSADGSTEDGAPKVENPLDTSAYQQDPCSSLSSAQLQELALDQGKPSENDSAGPNCFWRNNEARSMASIAFVTAGNNGISDVYANRENNAVFEELPAIEGHPVVAYGSVKGEIERGYCTLAVGATDELFLSISVRVSRANIGQDDPCESAQRVAEMMIETMRSGQ
ncbi:DUF3558 domain-containing protein [Tamaricihabitans halophyticus]|nr:DUF3558 domain-containing protein [Tamaricihabitans halophyticus]